MYDCALRKTVEKTFFKLATKNPEQLERIHNKIEEIKRDPHRYKNLRSPLQHLKRVHIDKSYVLVFSVDDYNKLVDYDHHDRIYRQ
jgi:YafQ family addiction module toxin component